MPREHTCTHDHSCTHVTTREHMCTCEPWDNFLKDPMVVQTLLSVSRKTPPFPTAELSELLSSCFFGSPCVGMGRYQIFADMLILLIPPILGRAPSRQYQQLFLLADTDTDDTETSADIFDTDTGIGPSLSLCTCHNIS